MKVDNFALTMHQTCPSKFDLRINQDWSVRRKSGALGFGGALHEGLAAWYSGKGLTGALTAIHEGWPAEVPVDDWRTKERCIQVMIDYARNYPVESFSVVGRGSDSPMVEVAFSLETGMFLSCFECGPITGIEDEDTPGICANCGQPLEPIEYGGIFDTLVDFSGQVYILEHKTTSVLGPYYFNQFKPNNQVSGYVWASEKLTGRRVGGAIINAIGLYKSSPTKFERSITTRNEGDIAEWLNDVKTTCEEIQQHRRTGYWPKRTNACTLYGLCEFHSVHVLTTEIERRKRLENDYVKDQWDYERRDVGKDSNA